MTRTHGDDLNGIPCPGCGFRNQNVSCKQKFAPGENVILQVSCKRCKKVVVYTGVSVLPLTAQLAETITDPVIATNA